MKFKYRPLPDLVTIKPSKIDGLGLFATQDIPKPRIIGRSHVQFTDEWERTPVGGFLNHSDNPNCELCLELDWDDYRTYNVYTTIDVYEGEELTLNYHSDDLKYAD